MYFENIEPFYEDENAMLILSDTFEILEKLQSDLVDMIFLSIEQKHEFNRRWIKLARKIEGELNAF